MVENEGSFEDRGGKGRSVRGRWRKKGGKVGDFTNFGFWVKTGPGKKVLRH